MKSVLMSVLALFAFTLPLTAEDAPVPSPVKSTLDTFEADALKAFVLYKQATAKASEKASKEMEAKLKAATKSGNLDLANAIKAELEKLSKGDILTVLEEKWKESDGKDLLGSPLNKGKNQQMTGTFKLVVVKRTDMDYSKIISSMKAIPAPDAPNAQITRLFDLEVRDAGYELTSGTTLAWNKPFQCSSLIMITRDRGSAEDSHFDMTVSVNGVKSAPIKEVPSDCILMINLGGLVHVSSLKLNYSDQINAPRFKKMALIP